MKKIIPLIGLLLCFSLVNSQVPYEYLDINNIKARVNAHPSLFWDLEGNSDYSFYENSILKSTIFAHGLWIGGKNSGVTYLAACTYSDDGQDFYPGPIANNYNSVYDAKYNRLWKINMAEIENHIINFDNSSYTMPEVIANWPAHGNTNNGEASTLAPFVDVNNNSYYDPQNGDYPYFNGYQAIFLILNDDRGAHGETNGEKLGVELHVMIYGYNCANYIIDKTVFISYKIINRSNNDYNNVYLGAFTDIDIGNGWNDYIGCDTIRNMYYVYNNNELDQMPVHTSQGVYFLNYPMSKFIYINNTTNANGTPTTSTHYYNYLLAKWKDGTPLTIGGNGYGDTIPTNYAFPGNPNDTVSWNEVAEGNAGGDRRGFGISGPLDFYKGDELCLVLAFVHATNTSSYYESINDLKFYESHLSSVFDDLNLDCNYWTGININSKDDIHISIFPNPTTGKIRVRAEGIERIEVMNMQGKIMHTIITSKAKQSVNNNGIASLSTVVRNDEIDLRTQPKGIYIIKVTTKHGVGIKKIVKQ